MLRLKGMSLVEVLVSTVLLALVLTGLANIFIAGKRYLLHSRSRMTAAELTKTFLDPLQMEVRQDIWDKPANCLTPGNTCQIDSPGGLDRAYTVNRVVSSPAPNLRKVVVNITWHEE